MHKKILTILFLVFWMVPCFAQVDTAWVRRYNGPGNGEDGATAVAVDNSGNVYVTGRSLGSGPSFDYATIKYHPNGDTAWVRRYNGPGNDQDRALAMAVDGSGNVYVTGFSYGGETSYDYATIKYYPNGDTAWVRRCGGEGIDEAHAIAVDDSGNVYVTGFSYGTWTSYDYVTIKYYPNGDVAWVRGYDVQGSDGEYAQDVAVDSWGNVYVTGYTVGNGMPDDYATIKYYPNGDTAWVRRYHNNSRASALAVDGSGNVYVTGHSWRYGQFSVYATIKYRPSGDTAWVREYNGPGNSDNRATSVVVDHSGNAYVTGYSIGSGTSDDYATIKYYPNGDTAWVRRYNGPGNSDDDAYALAVDGSGNVYVTGHSVGNGPLFDYATIKYYPDGDTAWVRRYNGPGNNDDRAIAVAVDGSGNVYVTGPSLGSGTDYDYATIKYVQCAANQPPRHVFIDSVRVWKHESGTYRMKLPADLDSIEVNDKICFYGRVTDSSGAGVRCINVTAFNAFGYNGTKNQGLDTVVTDVFGNFIFPTPAEQPVGLLCEYADLYPFWFAANDSVAIPIIIEALDQTTTLEAITDTLIALYGPILSKFSPHDSVMIGIPDTTDPLVVRFSYYPPNPLNLDDPANNHFMEGFVYNYHGPTDFRFLFDSTFTDTMVWLTRGAWFNNSRTKGVVDTLKNYFLGQPSVRILAIKDEFGQWHNVANQNLVMKGFWDDAWNAISYGIEAGICAGAIIGTLGTAAPVACAPLVVHVVADVTKAVAVPFLCDEVIKAEDPEQCRSVGGAITDIGAGIANICVTGGIKEIISGTETHLGYWLNPRNLAHGGLNGRLTAGARLYESATDWLDVGELYFNTVDLEAQYCHHPSLSQFQAYGYDGLVFEPPDTLDMLYGTDVGRYITMVDPPIQNYDVDMLTPPNAWTLKILVKANKPFYEDGTKNLIPPTIVLDNEYGTYVVPPSYISIDTDNVVYLAEIPATEIPGWNPFIGWRGRIGTSGPDIVSNLGVDSTSFQGSNYSHSSDLTMTLDDGSNIYIPQNALDTSCFISFGPSYQIGGGKLQDTSLFAARFLGHEYKVSPTNLRFNVPIRVGLKLNTLQFGDLGDSLLALVQFDSLTMEWTVIGTDIDSANSIIHGLTSKSGRFRAALMVEYLRGDANGDGVVDISDVVYLINYLFIHGPAPVPLAAGDANCDSGVDVSDVVYLLNYLFVKGPAPCE